MRVVLYSPRADNLHINRDLLYGCWCHGRRVADIVLPNIALATIGTLLSQDGHHVQIVDENASPDQPAGARGVPACDAVVILGNTHTFPFDLERLSSGRLQHAGVVTILCGQHVTAIPSDLDATDVDYGVLGEPEGPLRDLLRALDAAEDVGEIPGLTRRDERGRFQVQSPGPPLRDLDELPIPDRGLLPAGTYRHPLARRQPFTSVVSSRGCVGHCLFCNSPSFYQGTYRERSAPHVLAELQAVYQQGYREVLFRDEVFSIHPRRTREICEGLARSGVQLSWMCNAIAGRLDLETMQVMKAAGCHTLIIGVESGDPEILERIGKGTDLATIARTFEWARTVGLSTHAHFIVGHPGETRETVASTKRFIRRIRPTTIDVGIAVPYPGSRLYDMVLERAPELASQPLQHPAEMHTRSCHNEIICDLRPQELSQLTESIYREFYTDPRTIVRNVVAMRGAGGWRTRASSAIRVWRGLWESARSDS